MIKKLFVAPVLAAVAAVALALPVNTIWSTTNSDSVFLSEGATRFFELDLKLSGFRPGVDEPSWGNFIDLRLDFVDDAVDGNVGFNEIFGVTVAGLPGDYRFVGGNNFLNGHSFTFGLTADALAGVNANGLMQVGVTAFGGDFWLTGATLSAYGYTDLDAVPPEGLVRARYAPLGGLVSCWNGSEFVSVPGFTLECPGAGQQVPEPHSLALMGAALLGLALVHRRKRIAHAAWIFSLNLKANLKGLHS